jgi:peptidoglycan-N-acetylglucosamine deacetylase
MIYPFRSNWLMRTAYPDVLWDMPATSKTLYLTFDDGPHPEITPWVLETLHAFQAKATFFCIGNNVASHADTYAQILTAGHATGNHTFHHLNGWKTDDKTYFADIADAQRYIDSKLFRPPYGKISRFQAKQLQEHAGFKVVMWSVLSGDFDETLSAEKCFEVVRKYARDGSIIVFHDSEKAFPRLREALPKFLELTKNQGFKFESIR